MEEYFETNCFDGDDRSADRCVQWLRNADRGGTVDGRPVSVTSMENKPIIDYIVPQSTPNILVDCLGYQSVGEKEAIVKGRELPANFCLVDADSGEIVYRGVIEKTNYNADTKIFVGQVQFGDYEQPGNYYVECDIVGRSYTFPIVEKLYIQLFEENCDRIYTRCERNEATIQEVTELLTAYEWYPELFGDEDQNEVPDVLEIISGWMAGHDPGAAATDDEALQAALVAKFSYMYQKYDKPFATKCLQWASVLFEQSQKTMHRDAESFFALTELYRATGLWTYRSQIVDYKSYFENCSYLEEMEYLYGAMTYMVTRQKVDISLCQILIDKMMERGQELERRHGDTIDPVNAKNNGPKDVLKRADEIVFINYVLNSYQYHNVLKDFLHYLGGRNLQSVMFYPQDMQEEDMNIEDENYSMDGYLLLFAQMASMPEEE